MADDTGTAAPWLKLLRDAEEKEYHELCDRVDDLYGSLRKLSANRKDRQYQIFWANMQVIRPSIYSRAPVPVATSRFRDRRPLPRRAADILERALQADVDNDNLHSTLLHCRDDLAGSARGVPWLRTVERDGLEVPSAIHVGRKDFRCDPARKWSEVSWVARRVWLTKDEVKKRFGSVPKEMVFDERLDRDKQSKDHGAKKAQVWEVWHKVSRKVAWVSDGVVDVLDEMEPPLDLTGFFPCPCPAYGTLQPNTLTPVPDFVYYRDQVEEIHELTARIAGLQHSLRMKGFYAAGNSEVAEAVESAFRRVDNNSILVPISSMAALGSGSMKDAIAWWPIDQVVQTLQACIEVRRQMVEDVYEITGISDIMRGSTDANETLGAQQLKSQYGSVRIRERQEEMIRLARDVIRMKAEIMCENVTIEDLLMMAQVDDIPTQASLQEQVQEIMQKAFQQGQQMLQSITPETEQQVQEQIAQAAGQVQQQIAEIQGQVTVEQIGQLLKDQKLRPFALDIETDSTIQPDEQAEKQKRNEFLQAVAPFMQQLFAGMQAAGSAAPAAGKLFAEILRFTTSGYRIGRRMDDAIDDFAEGLENYQPPPPPEQAPGEDPQAAQMQAQAAMTKAQADAEMAKAEVPIRQQEAQLSAMETQAKVELTQAQTQKVMAEIAMAGRGAQVDEAAAQQDMVIKARNEGRTERQTQTDAQFRERDFRRSEKETQAKLQAMKRKA